MKQYKLFFTALVLLSLTSNTYAADDYDDENWYESFNIDEIFKTPEPPIPHEKIVNAPPPSAHARQKRPSKQQIWDEATKNRLQELVYKMIEDKEATMREIVSRLAALNWRKVATAMDIEGVGASGCMIIFYSFNKYVRSAIEMPFSLEEQQVINGFLVSQEQSIDYISLSQRLNPCNNFKYLRSPQDIINFTNTDPIAQTFLKLARRKIRSPKKELGCHSGECGNPSVNPFL